MIAVLALSAAASAPLPASANLPCDGIRLIEAASIERPTPFASLRQQGTMRAMVRDEAGRRVERDVAVTNVKPINGFARCRFVYSSQIDLACYLPTTISGGDDAAFNARLAESADAIGQCLTNTSLQRRPSEEGSTPSVHFSGGSRQPFWQISVVPTEEDTSRLQTEVLILGPAEVAAPARRPKAAPTAPRSKRKAR
jgi:hypothetical protein